jgi:hypothetical protein
MLVRPKKLIKVNTMGLWVLGVDAPLATIPQNAPNPKAIPANSARGKYSSSIMIEFLFRLLAVRLDGGLFALKPTAQAFEQPSINPANININVQEKRLAILASISDTAVPYLREWVERLTSPTNPNNPRPNHILCFFSTLALSLRFSCP